MQWRRPCQVKGSWREEGRFKLRHLLGGREGQRKRLGGPSAQRTLIPPAYLLLHDQACSLCPHGWWWSPEPLIYPAWESSPIRQGRHPCTFESIKRQPSWHAHPSPEGGAVERALQKIRRLGGSCGPGQWYSCHREKTEWEWATEIPRVRSRVLLTSTS